MSRKLYQRIRTVNSLRVRNEPIVPQFIYTIY